MSLLEAVAIADTLTGEPMKTEYDDTHRRGDHIWWVSNLDRFRSHYPDWDLTYDVPAIMNEMYQTNRERWKPEQ